MTCHALIVFLFGADNGGTIGHVFLGKRNGQGDPKDAKPALLVSSLRKDLVHILLPQNSILKDLCEDNILLSFVPLTAVIPTVALPPPPQQVKCTSYSIFRAR